MSTPAGPPRVWAPAARTVEIEDLDHPDGPQLVPTERGEDGRWTAERAPIDRYWVVLDGERFPDPGANRQPEGFDGPSAVFAPDAHSWSDLAWPGLDLPNAVLYEMHVGTFSAAGTFDGVIEHLDHLVDLGIDAIELMPVHTFPGERGWGYDGVILGAAQEAYGGPAGLQRLVDACHAKRLGVVLDVVYNHLGPLGNHIARFGPFFDDAKHTPWGAAVNLDGPGSEHVRRFLVDDAVRWVRDFHLDGLRLDAVHALVDSSRVHLVGEIAAAVHALQDETGRRAWVIVESDLNDPVVVRDAQDGGWGADASWSDDLHHALHAGVTGEQQRYYADFGRVADIAKALTEVYVDDGSDPSRRHRGTPAGPLDRRRFLGYTQNHDQVGNRVLGERLCHLADPELCRVAAAIVLTAPFVPMLFQGEEFAASSPFLYFTSHPDPELGRLVREGRQAEHGDEVDPGMVPDPQDEQTFLRSKLDWAELDDPAHRWMLDWYRALLRLRRQEIDLRSSAPEATSVDVDEAQRWLRIRRGAFTVLANLGADDVVIDVHDAAGRTHLTNRPGIVRSGTSWTLPPASVLILGP